MGIGNDILTGLGKGFFEAGSDFVNALVKSPHKRKEAYDSDFMPSHKLLNAASDGFSLTGRENLSALDSHMSCCVWGSPGQGKSTCVAAPSIINLMKHGHSVAIFDPNNELLPLVLGFSYKTGHHLKVIHYAKPDISDGYNPILRANDSSSIQKVASMLVRTSLGEGSKDPFWNAQSVLLLTLLIKVVKTYDKSLQHLTNVKLLLDHVVTGNMLDTIIAKTMDQEICQEWKQFLSLDKKMLISISSTCRAALSIFTDPAVQKITAFDTIDFESFRVEPTLLAIQNPTGDTHYYQNLSALFFEQFFSSIMAELPKREQKRSIFFVLDESGNLPLESLQVAASTLRKFSSGLLLLAQDYSQYVHLHGAHKASAIKSCCFAHVYFPSQPLSTCIDLEKTLGKYEFKDENNTTKVRPLLSADEIRCLEKGTALILTGNNPPIHARMYPYYSSSNRNNYNLPYQDIPSKLPFTAVPLIPLPK